VVDHPPPGGRYPHILPDGLHFLYWSFGGAGSPPGVYVGSADGSASRHLLDSNGAAVYALGHLFFRRESALMAQAFDLSTLAVSGNAFAVASGAGFVPRYNHSLLSAAAAGPIVYGRAAIVRRQFVWVNRDGGEIARVGEALDDSRSPSLSPDGKLIAFNGSSSGEHRIWLMDTARGVSSRGPLGFNPVWSPDGSRFAFTGSGGLYEQSILTGGEPRPIVTAPGASPGSASDWSPDGRFLLCEDLEGVAVVPVDGRGEPLPVVDTEFVEQDSKFSPDGNWIAYTSNESGEPQIYVQRFPGGAGRTRVSTSGGGMARWRGDGREIFYLALDGRLMAVPLRVERGPGATEALEALPPVPLFKTQLGPVLDPDTRQQYMVAPDGERFLLNAIVEDITPPITVILNWRPQRGLAER
jgi:hypothetical protein